MRLSAHGSGSRGFTLIELLAVTGIIALLSTVMLAGNARFGGVVQLQNLAYDIALTIRQAQVYGISVARFESGFSAGYGVNFDLTSNGSFAMFADAYPVDGGDGLFESTDNELVNQVTMPHGYSISKLCAPAGSDETSCNSVSRVDIAFKRPEPDAWISGSDTGCSYGTGSCLESARIVVRSPRGDTMSVVVEDNGQVYVRHSGS